MIAVADACGLLVVSPLTLLEIHQVVSIRADRRTADAIMGTLEFSIPVSNVASDHSARLGRG